MSKEKRRKHTEEFRKEALNLAIEQDYEYPGGSRNLDANESMLK